VALVGAIASLTTACSEGSTIDPEEIGPGFLDDKIVALSASTANSDPRLIGQTMFIDRSGQVTTIANTGMDGARVAASGGRVLFSDRKDDFILGNSLLRRERGTEEHIQHELIAFDKGRRYVSVYNFGYEEDGQAYRFDVAVGDEKGVEVRTFPYFILGVAACDNEVYGLAQNSAAEDRDAAPYVLLRLTAPPGDDGVVATWTPTTPVEPDGSAVCADGVFSYLQLKFRGPDRVESGVDIATWDIRSGKLDTVNVAGLGSDFRDYGRSVVADGSYYFVPSSTGAVTKVDRQSGKFKELFEVGLPENGHASSQTLIDDGAVYVLDVTAGSGDRAELRAYDLDSGKLLAKRTIDPILPLVNPQDMAVWDMAVIAPVNDW